MEILGLSIILFSLFIGLYIRLGEIVKAINELTKVLREKHD